MQLLQALQGGQYVELRITAVSFCQHGHHGAPPTAGHTAQFRFKPGRFDRVEEQQAGQPLQCEPLDEDAQVDRKKRRPPNAPSR